MSERKISVEFPRSMLEAQLEALREWVVRYGELNEGFHDVAQFALDLTLTCLTTVGVPEDIRKRAYATHRRLLAYREKYTLRSRGEIETGQRDLAIDSPNCNAFGEHVRDADAK